MENGFLSLVFIVSFYMALSSSAAAHYPLKEGFYGSSCPAAESIVRETVREAISQDPTMAGGLIRLHFHDCFVRGCDASVLLDSTPGNPSEKESPANKGSLRGFEVINKAKKEIESRCPRTVSCSDILAFAARDSASVSGGIRYRVSAGRRDGRISIDSDATRNLPAPTFDVNQLQQNFARKGFSLDEMVTLSGAHSIGVSRCSSFANRLKPVNATTAQDPTMSSTFAAYLKTKCSNGQVKVPLDIVTPNRLDNRYYKNLRKHKGLLASDQALWTNRSTSVIVRRNAKRRAEWADKFAAAMVRMGSIGVLTGAQGEVRNNCRVVN